MIQSEDLSDLAQALVLAQGKFEAVSKTADNPFFKSKYADLPSVVAAASPILAENGLAVVQMLGEDTLTTLLMHKSGQFLGDTARMHLAKVDPQGVGSAVTYYRRYTYMALLGLVADVDDDGNAASFPQTAPTVHREPPQRPSVSSGNKNYLTVPFKDKDAVKALGARWDKDAPQPGSDKKGRWYVPQGTDRAAFRTWLPAESPEDGVALARAAFQSNQPPPVEEPPAGLFEDEETF